VVDPSWDNFTNKLIPVRRADRLVVWNDIMKQQAVDLHGYTPDQIRVSGPPSGMPLSIEWSRIRGLALYSIGIGPFSSSRPARA